MQNIYLYLCKNYPMRLLFLVFIFFLNSSPLDCQENKNFPNDVRWVTSSFEYKELCNQIYTNAWISIRNKIYSSNEPVIVMDLDETVLDNSKYQIELFNKSTSYKPKTWNKWVKKEESDLVPGSKEFITRFKKIKNSKIIFLSNRDASTLNATKSNMKKLDILFADDIFLLKESEDDTKIVRRNEIIKGEGRMDKLGAKKIIAYFGDAIGDFPKDKNFEFGINKFLFPNPMYGKW